MTVTLRPALPEDEEFLCDLYCRSHAGKFAAAPLDDTQRGAMLRMQFNLQQQSYRTEFPTGNDRIILLDGEPIGRLLVAEMETEVLYIDIAIFIERRGNGIGAKVISDLMEETRRIGKPARLQVIKTNPAARLHQRLGFRITGENGAHYVMTWDPAKSGGGSDDA
ncbi:MAG: GNAT family N-acetyltransferase [Blastocatellales bacterium]